MLRLLVAPLAVLVLAASAAASPLGLEPDALLAEVESVAPEPLAPVVDEVAAVVSPPPASSSPAWGPGPPEHDEAPRSEPPAREPVHETLLDLVPEPSPVIPLPVAPPLDVARLVPEPPAVLQGPATATAPPAPPEPLEPASRAAPPEPAALPAGAVVAALAVTAAAPAASLAWDRFRRWGVLAVLYARIAKERLLDHGGRERLLEQVRLSAGAPLADLARDAGIPRNTAVYHLRRLEKEGLVSSVREGRVRLYFAPGSLERRENADALAALRHPTTRAIAREIGSAPGLDQRALCERMRLTPSLAHWHASRLAKAGVVEPQRDGRHVRYYPGPAMRLL